MNFSDFKRVTGDGDSFQTDHFGGSTSAIEHFIRLHAGEAVEKGVLIRHRGVWMGHRAGFAEFVLDVGKRMARRAVQRAHASDVAATRAA